MISVTSLRALSAAVLTAVAIIVPGAASASSAPGTELVVAFKKGASLANVADLHSRAGGIEVDRIDGLGLRVVRTPDVAQAKVRYMADPRVRFVEVNGTRRIQTNDPGLPDQYAVAITGLPSGWGITMGNPSPIAILDTGIDLEHDDLSAKIQGAYNAISNGGSADDDHGHGTHVAGIAAAVTNNAKGIAGVAPANPLFAVKVLGSDGTGSDSDITQGIVWAVDNGAKIINLSLGMGGTTYTLNAGLDYALERGVVLVAAAGNSPTTGCPHGPVNYPAAYPGVIAVSSTNASDGLSCFSNVGPEVSVSAPGESVLSTLPDGRYGYGSGTSMASPFVAGLAALVRSREPQMAVSDVKKVIEEMSYDLGPVLRDDNFGHGRVNAFQAVAAARSWFSDVPRWLPFSSYINFSRETGVVSGFGDGTFGPFDNVTRAAAAKMAVGAFNLPLYSGTEQSFIDTPVTHPLYRYVETLARAGIVQGVGGSIFAPDTPVTRGELSTIAARTAESRRGWVISADTVHFSDVPESHFGYLFVETLYRHGAILGITSPVIDPVTGSVLQPGRFGVDELVTRGAATKIFFSASHQP